VTLCNPTAALHEDSPAAAHTLHKEKNRTSYAFSNDAGSAAILSDSQPIT